MAAIDGQVPSDAQEITTGQANRVWYVDAPVPYVLKHYGDRARAANEAAALALLTQHNGPAPRLLGADPNGRPAWTAQSAVHAEPTPTDRLLDELDGPLAAVHCIPGQHVGRLAAAPRHRTWRDYLHNRLDTYTAAAPDLAQVAAALHRNLDALDVDTEPRLLHHDLQPGHLVRPFNGQPLLLDWELATLGDPLSDLARLAVRLDLTNPADVLQLAHRPPAAASRRIHLYWRIHQLADAALGTDPLVRQLARDRLS
ncbi:phosphotransferase family protein [Streptomyces zagrosensis]|uniref:Aminoglycoside phosphotransferase (APT) family kinase protein n=1 Tax=Streptomyces zagrosensis TaxID=1042984 RepID=A0A7W9QG63_9ACTN|nr:phosphotransferase [Streptomyces zagrosensis]MBB5939516.1 aminoglycoside phosphotransferase (APT) family kinase protein [Streptomyces zagrosensis]